MSTSAFSIGVFTVAYVIRGTNSGEHYNITDNPTTAISYTYGGGRPAIYVTRNDGAGASYHDLSGGFANDGVLTVVVHRFGGTNATNTLRVNGVDVSLTGGSSLDPGSTAHSQNLWIAWHA